MIPGVKIAIYEFCLTHSNLLGIITFDVILLDSD